jgi:hypothetical protein
MPANFQTVSAALISDRFDKTVHNLLQNDIAAWKKIPVRKRTWNGDVSIVVLRTARNDSVGSLVGSTEPQPGQQGLLRLTVAAKKYIGTGQIEMDALVAADDPKGSVAVEPMDEIENLLNDLQKRLCRDAFLGGAGIQGLDGLTVAGSMLGVIWQRSNAITAYGYRGRSDDIVAQAQAFNFARFIRLDTYAQVGADTLITDLSNRTLTLTANIDTSALPVGVPCGVMLVGAASQAFLDMRVTGNNTAGNPVTLAVAPAGRRVPMLVGDMTGFLSNLTQPLHFGQNRNSATAVGIDRLRSNFLVCNNTNAQGGSAIDGMEFDRSISRVRTNSGHKVDVIWQSFETVNGFGQSLQGAADANVRVQAQGGPQKMDAGAPAVEGNDAFTTGYSRQGIPICGSEQCPDGIALLMMYRSWERLFKGNKEEGQWLGVTGPGTSPLIKVPNNTSYSFTRLLYPEQVCKEPLSNALLVGIADPS